MCQTATAKAGLSIWTLLPPPRVHFSPTPGIEMNLMLSPLPAALADRKLFSLAISEPNLPL